MNYDITISFIEYIIDLSFSHKKYVLKLTYVRTLLKKKSNNIL